MIVGHFGLAAAVARVRPRGSLWWILPASIAPDLLDIGYAFTGICNPSGLYSHTVPAALLLGTTLAGIAVLSGRRETAVLILLVVLLHLPMDYVTGRKLFWPGGELHGLLLYDWPLRDFLLESALLAAGWAVLRGGGRGPRWATSVWSLVALLVLQGSVDGLRDWAKKPNSCARAVGAS